jgi:Family of unknown function (DUF6069)
LTVATAIVAVLAARAVAGLVLTVSPDFKPFLWASVIVFTTVLVTVAVLVFAVVVRVAGNPIGTYRRIAFVALVASMIPDLALPMSQNSGATWPAVIALMAIHVAAWWVTVQMLTKLTRSPEGG